MLPRFCERSDLSPERVEAKLTAANQTSNIDGLKYGRKVEPLQGRRQSNAMFMKDTKGQIATFLSHMKSSGNSSAPEDEDVSPATMAREAQAYLDIVHVQGISNYFVDKQMRKDVYLTIGVTPQADNLRPHRSSGVPSPTPGAVDVEQSEQQQFIISETSVQTQRERDEDLNQVVAKHMEVQLHQFHKKPVHWLHDMARPQETLFFDRPSTFPQVRGQLIFRGHGTAWACGKLGPLPRQAEFFCPSLLSREMVSQWHGSFLGASAALQDVYEDGENKEDTHEEVMELLLGASEADRHRVLVLVVGAGPL